MYKIALIYFCSGYEYNLNVFKSTIICKQKFRQYCLIFLRKFLDNFQNRLQSKLYKEIKVCDLQNMKNYFLIITGFYLKNLSKSLCMNVKRGLNRITKELK